MRTQVILCGQVCVSSVSNQFLKRAPKPSFLSRWWLRPFTAYIAENDKKQEQARLSKPPRRAKRAPFQAADGSSDRDEDDADRPEAYEGKGWVEDDDDGEHSRSLQRGREGSCSDAGANGNGERGVLAEDGLASDSGDEENRTEQNGGRGAEDDVAMSFTPRK